MTQHCIGKIVSSQYRWFLCIVIFSFNPLFSIGQTLKFVKTDSVITLMENGNPRFTYHLKTKSLNGKYPRANYVHPVYGIDGEMLTEDFPEDHLHHRGIFWSWHQLFFNGKRIADPWLCEGITWQVTNTNSNINDNSAILESEVYWLSKVNNNLPVIRESVKIVYSKIRDNVFEMHFEVSLTPLLDNLALGGSDDEKGYGGFSVRYRLPENPLFNSAYGEVIPKNLPLTDVGNWVSIYKKENKNTTGIIIEGNPEELPQYQGWILRSEKSMQNVAFPGAKAIVLQRDIPIIFKNKITFFKDIDEVTYFDLTSH